MVLPQITIDGRVGTEPELRFTPSGAAVASFRVVAGERRQDPDTKQWSDGRQCWVTVNCWRQLAENVAESLHKGDPVIVSGHLIEESYERDGQQRTILKVEARAVGPGLSVVTAQLHRAARQGGIPQEGQQGQQGQPQGPQQGSQQPQWGQQQGQQQGNYDPWANEPPF